MKTLAAFSLRYIAWLGLTVLITLGGASLLMVFKDWSLDALATSLLAWPLLGLAMVAGVPIAMLGLGRIYFYSAIGGGLLYNLYLLVS